MSEWMFDTMVSMTLLMAIVLMIRKPVAHFFGPHIAYLLWLVPVARLFMPTMTVEVVPTAIPEVEMVPMMIADTAAVAATAAAAPAPSIDWLTVAVALWLGGAGLFFVGKLAGYLQFREEILGDGRVCGRHGKITILETAAVSGPLAFGLFDRYIAVPTHFFRDFAPRERDLAIAHEVAHHEAGDMAANFVGLLILSLHWFNPVAWMAWTAFRQDQETACDARILALEGPEVRSTYGRTIAKSLSNHRLGLASPMNRNNKIKDRLKMLKQGEKSGLRRTLGTLMVGTSAVVALPLTATTVYAEVDATDDEDRMAVTKDVTVTVDENGEEKKTVKIRKRKLKDGEALTIDSGDADDAKYVRRYNKDGKNIVIRTTEPISDEEFEKIIRDAEKDRLEAEEHRLEADKHRIEIRKELEEARNELRRQLRDDGKELRRELKQARRDALQDLREEEAELRRELRGASAQDKMHLEAALTGIREARKQLDRDFSDMIATSLESALDGMSWGRVPEPPKPPQPPAPAKPQKIGFSISGSTNGAMVIHERQSGRMTTLLNMDGSNRMNIGNCSAVQLTPNSARGVMTERAWAALVKCSGLDPQRNQKTLLKMTLNSLKQARSAYAGTCSDGQDSEQRQILRAYDREIAHLKGKISRS